MPAQAVVYVVVAKFSVLEASAWVYGSVPKADAATRARVACMQAVGHAAVGAPVPL